MSPALARIQRTGNQAMTRGLVMGYVSLIVLLPIAAIVVTSLKRARRLLACRHHPQRSPR